MSCTFVTYADVIPQVRSTWYLVSSIYLVVLLPEPVLCCRAGGTEGLRPARIRVVSSVGAAWGVCAPRIRFPCDACMFSVGQAVGWSAAVGWSPLLHTAHGSHDEGRRTSCRFAAAALIFRTQRIAKALVLFFIRGWGTSEAHVKITQAQIGYVQRFCNLCVSRF